MSGEGGDDAIAGSGNDDTLAGGDGVDGGIQIFCGDGNDVFGGDFSPDQQPAQRQSAHIATDACS